MSGHTPGPWEPPSGPYVIPSTGEGPNFSGGDWEIVPPMGESGPVAITRSAEDARLIAAAPEMYELLRQIVDSVRDAGPFPDSTKPSMWTDRNQIEAARALLARIDGEDG